MTAVLTVMRKGNGSIAWQVYRDDVVPRKLYEAVRAVGPLVGSVKSWEDLDALAADQGVDAHQINGEGLDEMATELGPKID